MDEPLRITANLANGYVSHDQWTPAIDGILAWAIMRRDHPNMLDVGVLDEKPMILNVPLKRLGVGEDWYYACSSPVAPGSVEHVTWYHKRFDDCLIEYAEPGKRKKINVKSGRYKNYRLINVKRIVAAVTWHVIGDGGEIEKLLSTVRGIGAHRAAGLGRVVNWSVSVGDDETADAAKTLRPLPINGTAGLEYDLPAGISTFSVGNEGVQIMPWGLRPPAWWRGNQRLCRMPSFEETPSVPQIEHENSNVVGVD